MPVIDKHGVPMNIPVANPFALLWKAVSYCVAFVVFLEKRPLEVPSSMERPWRLILYTDGVTPGDPLTPMNDREFQACYWSFVEMGANALSREESWFTVMTEFETVVSDVSAGLSQLFGGIIKLFF